MFPRVQFNSQVSWFSFLHRALLAISVGSIAGVFYVLIGNPMCDWGVRIRGHSPGAGQLLRSRAAHWGVWLFLGAPGAESVRGQPWAKPSTKPPQKVQPPVDRAAFGGLTALCQAAQGSLLSGCPSGCWCLSPGPEALDGDKGGTVTSIQGMVSFPQVDSFLSALGSGSWGSISLVLHLPRIQGSLSSGVGYLCACPSRCS